MFLQRCQNSIATLKAKPVLLNTGERLLGVHGIWGLLGWNMRLSAHPEAFILPWGMGPGCSLIAAVASRSCQFSYSRTTKKKVHAQHITEHFYLRMLAIPENPNAHAWDTMQYLILCALLEKSLVLKLCFSLQSAFLYFCCLTDTEDDDSDSQEEMVTIFSLSMSFHLSTEGDRKKGEILHCSG